MSAILPLGASIALGSLVSIAAAADGKKAARDLSEASLEDLMNIEVTTVSKREQKLLQAPAAVFVITHEDIRRSGMTNLPDLLRMAPASKPARRRVASGQSALVDLTTATATSSWC
jgi:iron complex outermembrane receptor protein